MIELDVDAARLGRSRFAVSPLAEVTNALEVLVHPGRAPYAARWVAEVAQRLVWSDYGVLLALVEQATRYVPDFLVPIPSGAETGIEDEAAIVAATPAERVRRELSRAFGPEASARSGDADLPSHWPAAVAEVAQRRGEEGLAALLAEQLMRFWEVEMAGLWPSVLAVLDDDADQHAIAAGRTGFATVVDNLHPNLRWDGRRISMASAHQKRFGGGDGVVFMPSAFLPRPAVWVDPAGSAMIGYPARGRGRVWHRDHDVPGAGAAGRTGSGVFAGRWAELLRDLDVARSTGELAARHRISASTASYHLRRLHQAGLVTRRRARHRVLYVRTARASGTLDVLDAG